MLNATYPGVFIDEIKRFCHDNSIKLKNVTGGDWLRGDTEEIILNWFSNNEIPTFLASEQFNSFNSSIYPKTVLKILNWVQGLVDDRLRTKIYKTDDLFRLYEKYNDKTFDISKFKQKCVNYAANSEIENKKGIFEYALQEFNKEAPNEQLLQIRMFPSEWKEEFLKKQHNKCNICGKDLKNEIEYAKAELDHIISWKKGGLTEKTNCQLLCQKCNRHKSGK